MTLFVIVRVVFLASKGRIVAEKSIHNGTTGLFTRWRRQAKNKHEKSQFLLPVRAGKGRNAGAVTLIYIPQKAALVVR